MPYDQTGDNPNANISTYNDVAGDQHNTNISKPEEQINHGPVPSDVENDVRGDQHNANSSTSRDIVNGTVKKIVYEGKRMFSDWTGNGNSILVHNDKSVHNNANTTNNSDSHSVTTNTYHGPSLKDLLSLGIGRQAAEATASQPQLGASNGSTGNVGSLHSGDVVKGESRPEHGMGTHTNEDTPKIPTVPSPEGGEVARKPDVLPLSEHNTTDKPIEGTMNENSLLQARGRPLGTTEIKDIESVPAQNSVRAPSEDVATHHGVTVTPRVAEESTMSKSTHLHPINPPSGDFCGRSSNLSLSLDQLPSVVLPSENSQVAADSARILKHLRSYDWTRASRQASRVIDQLEKNSKVLEDALNLVRCWEPKAHELQHQPSVSELKKFLREFWDALAEVKDNFEEVASGSKLIADVTYQTVDELMEQAKKDVDAATQWSFYGAISCATVIGLPLGLVMFGRASHETGRGQQREKDAKHLDGIRKDTDSLATKMRRAAKWWSTLAEHITAIKRVMDGMEAGDTVPSAIIEALKNLHLSLDNYINAHEPSAAGVSRLTSD